MNITHYDVAIIGGGVAGMTAALYLKRANISCCIFEKNIPGGIINYTGQIENYPSYPNISGGDLAYNIYSQLQQNNIEFIFEDVISITSDKDNKSIITKNNTYTSKYVIIATMFIGRIGMLNLMIGLLREINHQFYEYPKENILIN